jgi:DNA-binding XRE family transcriptional regulator
MLMDRIRLARKTAHKTQQQFAAAIGVMRETQAAYEVGRYRPSLESLEVMAAEAQLPPFWFLLSADPVEFERQRKAFEREARTMARLVQVLGEFREWMRKTMSPNEWVSWEEIPVQELYSQIVAGRLAPLSQRDARKVHQYLRADSSQQGVEDAAFYLYAIWARPRHPSMTDADYVRRVSQIVYPDKVA